MASFYKFTCGTESVFGKTTYHEGLNVDPLPWKGQVCVAGGLHFTTLEHVAKWIGKNNYTHIWDVEIPKGETRIVFGETKAKAHSIIMRNMRPIDYIFDAYTTVEKAALIRRHPDLLHQFTWPTNIYHELNRATLVDVNLWSNGVKSRKVRDGYVIVMCQDWTTFGSDGVYLEGGVIHCAEVIDGLPHGPGTYKHDIWTFTGTFVYGYLNNPTRSDGTHSDRLKREFGRNLLCSCYAK